MSVHAANRHSVSMTFTLYAFENMLGLWYCCLQLYPENRSSKELPTALILALSSPLPWYSCLSIKILTTRLYPENKTCVLLFYRVTSQVSVSSSHLEFTVARVGEGAVPGVWVGSVKVIRGPLHRCIKRTWYSVWGESSFILCWWHCGIFVNIILTIATIYPHYWHCNSFLQPTLFLHVPH